MTESRRFDRVAELIGSDALTRLRGSCITVIGLGGVGSHAAAALARSGVGHLRLVDFDKVTQTSLNRNPFAGPEDVGSQKVLVAAAYIQQNCPDTAVETIPEFFHVETAESILTPVPDAVVDAIDSLNPKTALMEICVREGIPIFSSMGASGRSDPSMVRVGDLSETCGCPLAKMLRKYLRRRGVAEGIRCVYSLEPAGDHCLPPDAADALLERGRVRNRIPSSIVMPGIFGYALAGMVIDHLKK